MSNIAKIVGKRLRNYRLQQKLSQECLSELSGCHPTYIGQLERGEKNATLESIERISSSLNIPLSQLLEKIEDYNNDTSNYPLLCYEILADMSSQEQMKIYEILVAVTEYKST